MVEAWNVFILQESFMSCCSPLRLVGSNVVHAESYHLLFYHLVFVDGPYIYVKSQVMAFADPAGGFLELGE